MQNNAIIKTYGRTRGRKRKSVIIKYEKRIKKYLFKSVSKNKEVIIEIGSGNGDNIINLSVNNPNKIIIACEVYVDGNSSLVNKLIKYKITNVKIFNKSCFLLFKSINDFSINEVWILYPDPWPKKKHHKRRLINNNLIQTLHKILKTNGKIYIATDNKDYFFDILIKFYESKLFIWDNDNPGSWSKPSKLMAKTSYFLKAEKNRQKSNFLNFKKI